MTKRLSRWVLAVLVSGGLAAAQAPNLMRELAELDIEELLNLTVKSTTKSEGVTTRKAPGIVRVITRQEIERHGFMSLRDVLATVPGVQLQMYRAGHESVWFRGIKQRYNDKILWLIDGVPIRDSYYGHNDLDSFPLYVVERIEIINGPGGVLYGTNAFSGVVSITTRKQSRTARFNTGSFGQFGGGIDFNKGAVYVAAEQQHSEGFRPLRNNDGSDYRRPLDRDRTFGLFKIEHGRLQANAGYSRLRFQDAYREAYDNRLWTREPLWGSVGYGHDLAANLQLNVLAYYQRYGLERAQTEYAESGEILEESVEHLNTDLYGVDLTADFRVGTHHLVAGTSFQGDTAQDAHELMTFPSRERNLELAVPSVRRHNVGMFVQDVWTLNDSLSVTTGARFDYLTDFEDQFSYRAGLTGQRGRLYGKLLYGTAFRVPSYREYLSDSSYNFSLKPERLRTLEAQAGLAHSRADVSLTFYDNSYRDLIRELNVTTVINPDGTTREPSSSGLAVNAESSTIRGVELQAVLFPTSRINVVGSVGKILSARERVGELDPSYIFTVPVITEEVSSTFLAGLTANVAWSYRLSRHGHQVSLNGHWATRRPVPVEYQQNVPTKVRNAANADGFFKLDASATIPLSYQYAITLRATNLLNRRIYTPPFDDPTGYDAQWPSRALRVELVFRY